MPDRMIRDELLESSRWLGLPSNTERVAFVALMLSVDDYGNSEASTARLGRLWRDFGINADAKVERCLKLMIEADLARVYEVAGKRFIHLPRFRQRKRYWKHANPPSPWDLAVDHLGRPLEDQGTAEKKTGASLTEDRLKSDSSQKKRSEVKRSEERRLSSKPVVDSGVITNADAVARTRARARTPAAAAAANSKQPEKGNGQTPDGGTGKIVESIPTAEGVDFEIHESLAHEFERLYPHVDIPQTLREIRGYNLSNPEKRKPLDEVLGHVNRWLQKDENAP